MRHGKKFNHLSRKTAHRKAMLSNMACSLIEHKRINTTVAKAKALRGFVEPILTKSKTDSTHSRRIVFRYLQNKDMVNELFREVAPKIAERNGGYTRIIRTGYRLGDNAEMCMIELVDFNDIYSNETKKKTRRSRRGSSGGGAQAQTSAAETAEEVVEGATAESTEETTSEAPATETQEETPEAEVKEDVVAEEATEESTEETVEEPIAEAEEAKEEEAPAEEEAKEQPKAEAEASEEEKKEDDSSEEEKEEK